MTATFNIAPTLIASFAGYDVIAPLTLSVQTHYGEPDRTDVIPVQSGDVLAIAFTSRRGDELYDMFTMGSVVSYSLKSNVCPIRAVEQAVKRGHDLHWMTRNSVCITDSKFEAKPTYTGVKFGDVLRFEGRLFTITRDGNQGHAKLVEVK